MSKYNLTDILNEYVGGSKIGTLNISFKELSDKMEDIEMGGDYIVRRLEGPSGDGKVNREFEVVDREDAIGGGNKQEKGFTVYDFKFGFDPGDEDHYMDEYEFSVGGSNIALAKELLPGVEGWNIDEDSKSKEEIDESKDWIQKAIKRPGALHRELGVPLDKDIPKWKMDAAEDRLEDEEERDHEAGRDMTASDRRELRQIDLAKTLEKFTEAKDWIQKAIKRPGALHRALDIPRDKDIPHSLINKDIKKMDDLEDEEGHLDKRDLRFLRQLDLAKTLEKFNESEEPGKLSRMDDIVSTLGEDD